MDVIGNISRAIIKGAPYLTPWLFLSVAIDLEQVSEYLIRYLSFLLLFLSWNFFISASVRYRSKNVASKTSSEGATKKEVLFFVTSMILSFFFLHNLKLKIPGAFFYTTLAVMAAQAAQTIPWIDKSIWRKIGLYSLSIYGVVFLSLEVPGWHLEWQTFVFALGLSFAYTAYYASSLISRNTKDLRDAETGLKILGTLLFLGPTILGLFPLLGELPRTYLLVYLVLPIFGQALHNARQDGEKLGNIASLNTTVERGTLLFLLLLVLASVLT